MQNKMTWEEMKKAYPNEWLLIIDYQTNKSGHLTCGTVIRHSKSKNEVYTRQTVKQPSAFRYTGESSFMGLRSHAENSYHI